MQNLIVEALLLLMMIAVACCVIFIRDILSSVLVYGVFSCAAVLLYFMMGAADVAFTEAVIGAISTIYFVVVLKNINRWCK